MNEKKKDSRAGLNDIQLEMFEMLRDEKFSEPMCRGLVLAHDYVYLENAINKYKLKKITLQEYLMFQVRIKDLKSKERQVFSKLKSDYCIDPRDEYLAIQTVENYDMVNLIEIIKATPKGSLDMVTFAEERIIHHCRLKIVEVEPDPELKEKYNPGTVPF